MVAAAHGHRSDLPTLRQAGTIAADPVLDIDLEAEFDHHGDTIEFPAAEGRWTLTKGRFRLPAERCPPAKETAAHE